MFSLLLLLNIISRGQAAAFGPAYDVNSFPPEKKHTVMTAFENNEAVTPQMFGAIGDGITDDTKAFLDLTAHCNANPGALVSVPKGHYIINSPICFTADVTICGSGSGCLLDFSQIKDSSDPAILISGTFHELEELKRPQSKGQNKLLCRSTDLLSKGDIVAVLDPNDCSWSDERAYYKKGEYCEILSVIGNETILVHSLNDDYEAECTLALMESVQSEISGLNIRVYDRGNTVGMIPLKLYCGKNSLIRDVKTEGSNYAQIVVKDCYNILMDHIQADYVCTENTGLNYGVVVADSQFVQITNCKLNALRHGIAIGGGGEGINAVNRYVSVSDSVIGSVATTGADIHGNAQYIKYDGCSIFNGLSLSGSDLTIHNCDVYTDTRNLWMVISNLLNGSLNIIDNHFFTARNKLSSSNENLASIQLTPDSHREGEDIIRIEGNVFENCDSTILQIDATKCPNTCSLLLSRNFLGRGRIQIENIYHIFADGNTISSESLFLNTAEPSCASTEFVSFTNNMVYSVEGDGLTIESSTSIPMTVNITDNTFFGINGNAVTIKEKNKMNVVMRSNTYISCVEESVIN